MAFVLNRLDDNLKEVKGDVESPPFPRLDVSKSNLGLISDILDDDIIVRLRKEINQRPQATQVDIIVQAW